MDYEIEPSTNVAIIQSNLMLNALPEKQGLKVDSVQNGDGK